jgi:opacity protein-like surface antigen
MQRIKTKVLAAAVLCALMVISAHQSTAEEKAKHRSIVNYWKNLYVRLDVAKRYNRKVTGFARHPKTANVIGAGIGYQFFDWPVRMEFNVQRSNFNVTDDPSNWLKAKTQTSIFNVYRDFTLPEAIRKKAPLTQKVIPYVTGGIGSARHNKISGIIINKKDNSLVNYSHGYKKCIAWHMGAGVHFSMDKVFSVDIGYRYVDLGQIPDKILTSTTPINSTAKVHGHQCTVALLMNFW